MNKRTSEWLSTYVLIVGCFEPLCTAPSRTWTVCAVATNVSATTVIQVMGESRWAAISIRLASTMSVDRAFVVWLGLFFLYGRTDIWMDG